LPLSDENSRGKVQNVCGDSSAIYEEERNKGAFPLFEFTCQLATLAPPPPETQQLLAALLGNQEQTDRFFGIFVQTVSVPDFFAAENVQKILRRNQPIGA
jgi:hypothetical protein